MHARAIPLFALTAALSFASGCSTQKAKPETPDTDDLGTGTDDADVIGGDDGGTGATADFAGVKGDLTMAPGDMATGVGPNGCQTPLLIKPANQLVYVDGVHQFKVGYQVFCGAFDIASLATLTVDDGSLGAFAGSVFTTAVAANGTSMVHAKYGNSTVQTGITVKPTTIVIGPNTPMNAPGQFGGANDANLAPTWVYPADGVLVPPNLSELEFQFTPKGNTALYELGFNGGGLKLKVYTVCNSVNGGCAFELDQPTWVLLSTVARGQAVQVTVRATGMNGGSVGTSATRTINFSDEDVTGGLYYWAASLGGIYRYDFGLRNQKGEAFYTPGQAGAMCVGCHSLSRDGTRISVGLNIPGPATMQILDVATKKVLYQLGNGFGSGSNFETLMPDASRILTTEAGGLTVRDAATGNLIGANPQVTNANMPDLSFDGTQVVFVRGDPTCTFTCQTLAATNAGLFTVSFANNAFGQPKQIVTPVHGQDSYYPSYSPDGKFVVFNRSTTPDKDGNFDSYDKPDAKVMIVPSAGGGVIDLAGVNAITGNSWPKWAPFSHHFMGGTVFWMTFSTRRPYGLRGGTAAQLWMVGVDAAKLGNGVDGAYPAFRLPFQDFGSGNHIAQWAQKVARRPCGLSMGGNACGPGEVCAGGHCQPAP